MRTFQVTLIVAAALLAAGHLVAGQPQGTVLWTYEAGYPIQSSPALAPEGTVYFAAGSGLYAITNNASTASNKWIAPILSNGGSPAIRSDGVVYISCFQTPSLSALYAVNPDGSMRWFFPGGSNRSPAVGQDGTAYIAGYARLYAVSPRGETNWVSPGGGGSYTFGVQFIQRRAVVVTVTDLLTGQVVRNKEHLQQLLQR